LPFLRLLGGQVAIGAAAIFARYALTGAGPIAVSALRLAIATLALFAVAGRLQRVSRARERLFVFAGIALALHFATWIASLSYTSVAISTLLVTTTPLWTEAFDVVRERRAPAASFLGAVSLAFAGVALIATERNGKPPIAGHELFGDALALGGSIAIGAYLLLIRDAATDASGARMQTRQIVVRTYGYAALVLLLAAAFTHQGPPRPSDAIAWGGIIAMALVSQLLGHTALNASLAFFTPSVVALSTLCEPVVAAVLAAVAFHERIGPKTALGGVLVLGAVALVLRASLPQRNPSASVTL
jgi:drug/metabolite transporter (DMT)-like permease